MNYSYSVSCSLAARLLTGYLVRVAVLAPVVSLHGISQILISRQTTHLLKKLEGEREREKKGGGKDVVKLLPRN